MRESYISCKLGRELYHSRSKRQYCSFVNITVTVTININILQGPIKTHDSESRGQEEAGYTQRTNELFTCSTALKFVNALNKPP